MRRGPGAATAPTEENTEKPLPFQVLSVQDSAFSTWHLMKQTPFQKGPCCVGDLTAWGALQTTHVRNSGPVLRDCLQNTARRWRSKYDSELCSIQQAETWGTRGWKEPSHRLQAVPQTWGKITLRGHAAFTNRLLKNCSEVSSVSVNHTQRPGLVKVSNAVRRHCDQGDYY